jgi:hypothetical protein
LEKGLLTDIEGALEVELWAAVVAELMLFLMAAPAEDALLFS